MQPSSVTVVAPAAATFEVIASGASAYQWRRNGSDIAGAVQSRYEISSTVPADDGASFSVEVRNAAGAVLSSPATLRVSRPPAGTLAMRSLLHDGVTRTYLEYTPLALPAAPVPLVVVLHGGSLDAATTASPALPTFAWQPLADIENLLVVYPDGINNQWNDCRSDDDVDESVDDVGFIDTLISKLASERAIDLTRVYVTGASNGGMMSYRVAQELAPRIAGIGAFIANLPVDPGGVCTPSGLPVGVVIVNGTVDTLMPFAGGAVTGNPMRGFVISAPATRDYWAGVNGCTGPISEQMLPDLDPTDGATIARQRYASCSSGKPVVLLRVDGGGHTTPSLAYFTAGRQSRDLEGADEVWSVLRTLRR